MGIGGVIYKDHLSLSMAELGLDDRVLFVGYGLSFDNAAAGTLSGVPKEKRIEMPLAENLMASAAIGMAMAGFIPVIFIERFDFILNASDAIVNHLDKIAAMSGGEFSPCAIIRVVVGGKEKPLFTGPTHTQDFSMAFRRMVSFEIIRLCESSVIQESYRHALRQAGSGISSVMLVEYKDKYHES